MSSSEKELSCIFCRNKKQEFNDEHIFPASIGGAFIIKTVCTHCNSILGKNIDDPFSKHEVNSYYRNHLMISRDNKRNIPNPFSGIHKNDDGNNVRVEFNEEGLLVSNVIPEYKVISSDDENSIIEVIIPLQDFDEEKIKKRIAKRFNLDSNNIKTLSLKIIPLKSPSTLTIESETNPFILGTMKIAYEFAIHYIPEYINDPISKEIANILLNKDINKYEKKFYSKDESIRADLINRVESIEGIHIYHHAVILTTIPGKGLCCVVRVFNWSCTFCLSEKEDYLRAEILILNDSIHRTWWTNVLAKLNSIKVNLDLSKLNYGLQFKIQKDLNKLSGFKSSENLLPIFGAEGTILFNNIIELARSLRAEPEHYRNKEKLISMQANYEKDKYFLKFFEEDILIPILNITFIYEKMN